MGMIIAIDKLYINKMPKSCKECPLTYLDTGDDAFFGANERRCIIDDSCVDGMVSERPCDCPLVEAIPKAEYRVMLKVDVRVILNKIRTEIKALEEGITSYHNDRPWIFKDEVLAIIDKYKKERKCGGEE